ncbi:MAG: galactokinase [Deltaproteobacteria bacterium]
MIAESFQSLYGSAPEVVVRAPGRVNLIGEHTDYNDGFVLPAAIDRAIEMAARRRADHTVRVHSFDYSQSVEFSLHAIEHDPQHRWSNYLRGVTKFFQMATHALEGADIAFLGDVPREAGLSSSAALEVATVACWEKLAGIKLDPVFGVKLAQRSENEFVGLPCGVMDQFASALSRAGHALFLDCRDLSFRHVPLPADVAIAVCNTGVRRELTQSEYEVRLKQCRQAVAQLGTTGLAVKSLREVDIEDLESARGELGDLLYRRARHVVTENQRVLDAVRTLEGGDLDRFGELMGKSHESLRDDYEVSCRELDTLVESAWSQPGVIGARMTGGGFGGCTVNLVEADAAGDFVKAVAADYKQALRLDAEIYVCQASDGALNH